MSWKTIRLAILVILGLVLAAVPGLVGCGGAETEKVNVVVGSLADFSGAASSAVVPTVDAYEEAIIYYQEKDPIKGVIFDFPHCSIHARIKPEGTLCLAGEAERYAYDLSREFATLVKEIKLRCS